MIPADLGYVAFIGMMSWAQGEVASRRWCSECGGQGYVQDVARTRELAEASGGTTPLYATMECPTCHGARMVYTELQPTPPYLNSGLFGGNGDSVNDG